MFPANYLANNPTPDHVKKQLELKEAAAASSDTTEEELCKSLVERKSSDSTEEDLCKALLKRKSQDDEMASGTATENQQRHPKRVRGLKPFLISSEEAAKLNELGEENPFVQLLNDEALYHQVILLMTLEADSKDTRKPSETEGPISSVIGEGFYWRDYPELEKILYDNMEAYYNMSLTSRQSRLQQHFNNRMVASIRETAISHGYSFSPNFNDKRLRDRMRCFYKTHLQNAKKRLATMQKHPNSILNQSQLRLWISGAKEQLSKYTELQQEADEKAVDPADS